MGNFRTKKASTTRTRFSPSGHNRVLCSYAMDRPVFYAQCDNATALPVLHQEIQGEVLHEIAGIVPQGLQREPTFATALRALNRHVGDAARVNRLKTACDRGPGEPGRVPGGKRVAGGNSHRAQRGSRVTTQRGPALSCVDRTRKGGAHAGARQRTQHRADTAPVLTP